MRPLLIAALALAVSGCGGNTAEGVSQPTADPDTQPDSAVYDAYAGLTPSQRVRQLVMAPIDTVDPDGARAVVRATKPGGLIIMAPGTARQWRAVVKAAQSEAARQGLPPLLIGADQENGTLVRRMRMPVTVPGAMVLGAAVAGDRARGTDSARDAAALTGSWLRAAGVNIDFAPVADVNVRPSNPVIGIRSPGAFPGIVGDAVTGQVAGFGDSGVLATAKHFPGHGDTTTDSHVGLAKVTHTRAQMARIDLPPFQAAVSADVPAIMVAHVTVPAYDRRPATVSKRIVTGVLRKRMGFDGLVVSDSLGMAAVANRPNLAAQVIAAGVDVLLMPNNPGAAVAQVKRAAGSPRLSKARVRQAVTHVLAAKHRLGLLDRPPTYPKPPTVPTSKRVARSVAETGITVLGSCRVQVRTGATVIGSGAAATGVRQGLRAAGIPSGPTRIVVQQGLPGTADVWVATGSPYAALNSSVRQRVLTYGDVKASGWAAGQALAGRLDRLGGLPVRGPKPCVAVN